MVEMKSADKAVVSADPAAASGGSHELLLEAPRPPCDRLVPTAQATIDAAALEPELRDPMPAALHLLAIRVDASAAMRVRAAGPHRPKAMPSKPVAHRRLTQ